MDKGAGAVGKHIGFREGEALMERYVTAVDDVADDSPVDRLWVAYGAVLESCTFPNGIEIGALGARQHHHSIFRPRDAADFLWDRHNKIMVSLELILYYLY